MPDVQASSSTLRKLAQVASSSAVELYKYAAGYLALAFIVALALICSVPGLRHQAVQGMALLANSFSETAHAESTPPTLAPASRLVVGDVLSDARPVVLAHIPAKQADAVQDYIGTKYKIPGAAAGALMSAAWSAGADLKVDPLLLLAVMAIESSFNPFAESKMGAQGLMQVMTRVHTDKFEAFGGDHAAFDPVANIQVGGRILKDCIQRRGSVPGGLYCYVGATGPSDGGYGNRVLAEHGRLRAAAGVKGSESRLAEAAPAPKASAPRAVASARNTTQRPTTVAGM